MRGMNFVDLRDAKMRLDGTIIRYGDNPILVLEAVIDERQAEFLLFTKFLSNGKQRNIPLKDKMLDFDPVPLGNMNYRGDCYFLSRQPQRAWKQGLHMNSLSARSMRMGYARLGTDTKAIAKTIKGEYPSAKEAFKLVDEDVVSSCGFSRNFSIEKERAIVFNARSVIGSLKKDFKSYELFEDFHYFKEMLDKEILGDDR